jgi:hypothetical protein
MTEEEMDRIMELPSEVVDRIIKAAGEEHVIPHEVKENNAMVDRLEMAKTISIELGYGKLSQRQLAKWLVGGLPKAANKLVGDAMDINLKLAASMIESEVKEIKEESPLAGEETLYGNIQGDQVTGRCIPTPNQLACAALDLPCLEPIPAITPNKDTTVKLFGSCLVHGLTEANLFPKDLDWSKKIEYAQAVTECVLRICYSGTIHSKNKSLRTLQVSDATYNFSKLFERKGSYTKGKSSFKYWTTDVTDTIVLPSALSHFSELEFNVIQPDPTDLLLDKDILNTLRDGRGIVALLTGIKGVNSEGKYVINYTEIDRQESRKYNTFVGISPVTRKHLGYINYDLSAALQRIVFNELPVDDFPAHKQLLDDKEKFRKDLSDELDKTVSEVKTLLTAADNGQEKSHLMSKSKLLSQYVEESDKMVKDYIDIFKAKYPDKHTIALKYADNGKIHSILFFCWTQIEREVRDVMIGCFTDQNDVREVHDAVYSKEEIDCSVIEKAIKTKLGLDLIVDH